MCVNLPSLSEQRDERKYDPAILGQPWVCLWQRHQPMARGEPVVDFSSRSVCIKISQQPYPRECLNVAVNARKLSGDIRRVKHILLLLTQWSIFLDLLQPDSLCLQADEPRHHTIALSRSDIYRYHTGSSQVRIDRSDLLVLALDRFRRGPAIYRQLSDFSPTQVAEENRTHEEHPLNHLRLAVWSVGKHRMSANALHVSCSTSMLTGF